MSPPKHRCWRIGQPCFSRSLLVWFHEGGELKKNQKNSLPELLPKIATSTITAEEALAALLEPAAAFWQGRAPPLVLGSTWNTCLLPAQAFSPSDLGNIHTLPYWPLRLILFVSCNSLLFSFLPNSFGIVLIRVKRVSQALWIPELHCYTMLAMWRM